MRRRKQPKDDDENGFGEWGGYMDAKIQKLEQQYAANAAHNPFKKSDLFAGIAIFVNGLTNPTADELKRIMMTHGGVYHAYYRSGVTTFIIAENLPDVKIRALRASRTIIRADWVVECVRQMRIVDYSKYLLYSNSTRSDQPKLCFGPAVVSAKTEELPQLNAESGPNEATDCTETNALSIPSASNIDIGVEAAADDEDMFVDDDTDIDEDNSPIVVLPETKTETPLNNSFNIAANLDFLNVKLRKQPSSSNLQVPETPIPAETTATTELNCAAPDAKSSNTGAPKSGVFTAAETAATTDRNCAAPAAKSTNPGATKSAVRTAVDPAFLSEFYNNSRLHHIATLGASFKNHICTLRETSDLKDFPARQSISVPDNRSDGATTPPPSTIMHIDMDCFFVSVGLRSRPHLRGQPVAVTHSKGGAQAQVRPGADPQRERELWELKRRNNVHTENRVDTKTSSLPLHATDSLAEIASCSYEARACGLKNGMFVGAALKLCPQLATIPYDFADYKQVAQQLYDTVTKYTLDIEAVSCDEMYVELSDILHTTGLSAAQFVTHLRREIQALTGCPCSAGVGGNRLQARMATKRAKPNGQYLLAGDDVRAYFADIELAQMPGIGYAMQQKLHQLGWRLCSDLLEVPVSQLQTEFGRKVGENLYQSVRGIDAKPLVYGQQRKSVSAEVNYGIRFALDSEYETFLRQLCAEVHSRLTEIRHRGKSVTLKLMVRAADAPVETAKFMGHGVCDNLTKTITLTEVTDDVELIECTVFAIKRALNVQPEEIRGIGIQIGKLVGASDKAPVPAESRLKTMFANVKPKQSAVIQPEAITTSRSPVKTTIKSPRKSPAKSPPRKRTLRSKRSISLDGPAIRKRAETKNQIKAKSIKNSVLNMIRQATTSESQDEIDPVVLAELPDDIREEVLRDFRRNQIRQRAEVKPAKLSEPAELESALDNEFLMALPRDLREEVLENEKRERLHRQRVAENLVLAEEILKPSVVEDTKPSEDDCIDNLDKNILLQSDWRVTLQTWIDTISVGDEQPAQSDIEVIIDSVAEIIRARKLNDVYLRMRYLFRIINEKNVCVWHGVYRQIVACLQVEMRREFSGKLQVNEKFSCPNSSCH